ncbi:hypothetical protein LPJ74_002291 [Coemansia sp. RSA 1843]|nr:hypothetical protein LPJ74_002291 [Coemansia sp. RSA 1843]
MEPRQCRKNYSSSNGGWHLRLETIGDLVVWREMALDVAAFLWAPLVGAGARAVAAAKDSVLSEWRQRRRQAGSKEHHRK